MLAGVLSILSLPINQYPNIAAPAVQISGTYSGASAQTVQDTVVQVVEQQLNGLDNLRYISSASNSDGTFTITVTFEQGTNPDIAQVQVRSEEHTSELQSLMRISYAVFCLKTKNHKIHLTQTQH